MELEHTFTVPVPEERAWDVLLDVERVAPCMPGASLDSVDGDQIKGRIKVKVGPISMTYAGTARFTERDPQAHVITLEATGKETRGAGTASATVRSMLEGQGDQTRVIVHTTLNVTGRPAQFGRGVMAEVGGKLIGIFASNLADMLTADSAAEHTAAASPAETSARIGAEYDLALPVGELHLALRSHNSLRRDGIHTVGELAARTEQQLLAMDNIGPASVEEIRQKLAERGCCQRRRAEPGRRQRRLQAGCPVPRPWCWPGRRQAAGRRCHRPAERGGPARAQARDPGAGRPRAGDRDRAAVPHPAAPGRPLAHSAWRRERRAGRLAPPAAQEPGGSLTDAGTPRMAAPIR